MLRYDFTIGKKKTSYDVTNFMMLSEKTNNITEIEIQ